MVKLRVAVISTSVGAGSCDVRTMLWGVRRPAGDKHKGGQLGSGRGIDGDGQGIYLMSWRDRGSRVGSAGLPTPTAPSTQVRTNIQSVTGNIVDVDGILACASPVPSARECA